MNQSKLKTRLERDSIGPVDVPKDAYYGSFTTRALKNFQISGECAPEAFKIALGFVKLAAAQANTELGNLNQKLSQAIQKAAREFMDGKFDEHFQIDIFQAGAGTPYNMNSNEIIANRANELLSAEKGTYKFVHPNNHVNMSQSSNDVIPTSIRLTILMLAPKIMESGKLFQKSLEKKTREFANVLKTGRTHLQDAVPVTLGQEFGSFATAVEKDLKTLASALDGLRELGIGATALGTGINTNPKYQKTVIQKLSKLTGLKLLPTKNLFELTSNMNAFLAVSSAFRALATTLQRIAEDLKLLGMSALAELALPEVEPGSSIMPGKINPSVCECMQMISYQVIGNDTAVALACQKSQLELNVMTPLILKNLVHSLELLINGMHMFRIDCIDGIKANKERCQKLLDESNCVATALSPHIGYAMTAELFKESRRTGTPIQTLAEQKKIMPPEKLAKILNAKNLTSPHEL